MKTCDFCKKTIKEKNWPGVGYCEYPSGHIACYSCCALMDQRYMERHGKNTLYWDGEHITNWPGTLKFKPFKIRKGRHNIAGSREDVWFNFNGKVWHGVQYGDSSQICHCRETKQEAA